MNILQAIESPKAFRPFFKDLKSWANWRIFLRVLFSLQPEPGDLEILEKCTGLTAFPRKQYREAYAIISRRGGKSTICSVIAVFLALFVNWRPYLAKGEVGHIFIIACNKYQAGIIREKVAAILNLQASFRSMIKKSLAEEIQLKNGITIAVKASNFRGIRGFSCVSVILEELNFWKWEEAANTDTEILRAIKPAMMKNSIMLGISSPWMAAGAMYSAYKRHYGKPGPVLIWKSDTVTMNPSFDKAIIDQAYEDDPESAKSEFGGQFRQDISNFLDISVIEQAVILNRYELPVLDGTTYHAFIDAAGGKAGGDSFSLGISHRDNTTGRIILDVAKDEKPPFAPERITEQFSEILKKYGCYTATADRFGGKWVNDSFQKFGVKILPSELTKSEIYLEVLPSLNNGTVELLDIPLLISQIKRLERRTRSSGKDSVDVFGGGHDDLCNSSFGAINLATAKLKRMGRVHYAGRPPEGERKEGTGRGRRKGRIFAGKSDGRDLALEQRLRDSLK